MTPEGRVKKKISAVLAKYKQTHYLYYYMPVPGGFGRQSLDYLGFVNGFGFAIEAKRPGGKPTPRQLGCIEEIEKSRATVFVIDGDQGVAELERWLETIVTVVLGRYYHVGLSAGDQDAPQGAAAA